MGKPDRGSSRGSNRYGRVGMAEKIKLVRGMHLSILPCGWDAVTLGDKLRSSSCKPILRIGSKGIVLPIHRKRGSAVFGPRFQPPKRIGNTHSYTKLRRGNHDRLCTYNENMHIYLANFMTSNACLQCFNTITRWPILLQDISSPYSSQYYI